MHIDDLNDQIMNTFIKRRIINKRPFMNLKKIYKCKAENLYKKINFFNKNYKDIILENLTAGLDYKLFSTFVSYLDKKKVSYKTKLIEDQNGSFSEFSRNKNFGQISILSIKPNQTRGNHFHNLKVEKFQLINGKATFFFKSMMTKKKFSVNMNSNRNNLIYSIPGYLHSIKNISKHKIHFVIWSNQLFNKKKPDTFKI